jgi:hypothetical protein
MRVSLPNGRKSLDGEYAGNWKGIRVPVFQHLRKDNCLEVEMDKVKRTCTIPNYEESTVHV